MKFSSVVAVGIPYRQSGLSARHSGGCELISVEVKQRKIEAHWEEEEEGEEEVKEEEVKEEKDEDEGV